MNRAQQRPITSGASQHVTLPVREQLYSTAFPFSSYRPREIGCISVNAKGRFHNDTRNKHYLRVDPRPVVNVHWDLMMGYHDRYIKMIYDSSGEHLHKLLRWSLESRKQLQAATGEGEGKTSAHERPLNFDFVARRGHLAKVFLTPYAKQGWKMAVTLFRGTYFLLEEWDEERYSERAEQYNYMGHKFEQYMTSAKPHQKPDPYAVLDNNEAFFTVLQSSINSHSLLFSAEVDGQDITCDEQEAPACYVEMKTTQARGATRNVSSFAKLKWWAQSFLAGIPRIIVGFKKDEQHVEACVMFNVTEDGLRQAAGRSWENSDYWKPAVCMNFLDAFLSFVKKVVTEDNHEVVYTFSWKVHEDVHYSVKRGPEHCFLLPEYIESVMSTGGLATQPLLNRGQAEAQ